MRTRPFPSLSKWQALFVGWNAAISNNTNPAVQMQRVERWNGILWRTLQWEAALQDCKIELDTCRFQLNEYENRGSAGCISMLEDVPDCKFDQCNPDRVESTLDSYMRALSPKGYSPRTAWTQCLWICGFQMRADSLSCKTISLLTTSY